MAAVVCELVEDDSDVVLAVDVFRDEAACERTAGVGCCTFDCVVIAADDDEDGVCGVNGAVVAIGVCGGRGESIVPPLVLPPVLPLAVVLRVKNQHSIGVGLPFITTGPRYSR